MPVWFAALLLENKQKAALLTISWVIYTSVRKRLASGSTLLIRANLMIAAWLQILQQAILLPMLKA